MKLSIRQKTNIRHFAYYLVNGSLDYEMLNNELKVSYDDYLREHPELFFKACCVFINHECKSDPDWPAVNRIAEFICKTIAPDNFKHLKDFEEWEINFDFESDDFAGSFKSFAYLFSINHAASPLLDGISYKDLLDDGASFVEQCFAIWSNVIEFHNGNVSNQEHTLGRVKEYIKSYFLPDYKGNLDHWECELH